MSQENVEVVRGAFALMTIPGDPETMIAASDPGFEMHLVGVGGGTAYYAGASGIREFFRDVAESWESFRFEATDLRDLGDRVLVLGDVRGRGRVSGVEVDDQWAWIVELRAGRAASLRGFLDQREALAAAGLSEQVMSEENVEVVRRVYEGWARGDFSAADAFDPEVEFEMVDWPEGSRSRGLDGMRRSWRAALGAWEEFRAVPTEFIDAGGDVVVVLNRIEGRGKESGLDVRADTATVWVLKDGQVAHLALQWNTADALKVAGLREQGAQSPLSPKLLHRSTPPQSDGSQTAARAWSKGTKWTEREKE